MTRLDLSLGERGYPIFVGRGLLSSVEEFFNLNRRVLIITDSGVPREYAEAVQKKARDGVIVTVAEGEGSKSPEVYVSLLNKCLEIGMTRSDAVVAVGGGVVGDLSGFVAASFMRGVDFYNIPTTLLSEVDSSIGGKVAINLSGVKNVVGAFYQPKAVLIDPDTLRTLPKRQIANGAAEAVKMALTSDKELFELIEREGVTDDNVEEIIIRSLRIKKTVVEADERESGLRKILNFGHTFGHAVESLTGMEELYHGECVAIGMCVAVSNDLYKRLVPVLRKIGLPTEYRGDISTLSELISHDKKASGDTLSVVLSDEVGSYRLVKMSTKGFVSMVNSQIARYPKE